MHAKPPGRFYDFLKITCGAVLTLTMRRKTAGLEHEPASGGCLVAVSHLNHLDPILTSTLLKRRIGWMARVEFYRQRFMRTFLYHGGAFPVNRSGYARPALREALARLEAGEMVGLFPEGEIMSGSSTVFRQGRVKQGVCWLAAQARVPVLPVIVLGSDKLVNIGPWLPARWGKLWILAGPPLTAPPDAGTKAGRAAFAAVLETEFRRLYAEARTRYSLPETVLP